MTRAQADATEKAPWNPRGGLNEIRHSDYSDRARRVPVADADRFGHSVSVAYPLTFSTDFFWNENADSTMPRTNEKRPSSVEQALTQISNETWERLARDVFDCEPEYLNIEAVLQKIEETNTCLNLDSPVEVLIDPDGEFTVLVYDRADS